MCLFYCITNLLFLLRGESQGAIVPTNCGNVKGLEVDGAYSFRGIPFASPPVNSLRWKPPLELSPSANNCWKGVFEASAYGNQCFQVDPDDHKTLIGSEDCLYLNVLTPTLDRNAKKPVMVWIHGGSLQFANGNYPLYSPTEKLAKETDVVYVGFNYRLHAFGFMALQMLADATSTKTSGNYGLMDMIAVLKWVKTNIENFGGDPNQVTVFGQSSGGTAIFALLASPLCDGLFHKAWMLSASPVLNKTAADAFVDNEVFLRNSNCSTLECIYALSSAEVTTSVPWLTYPYWAMTDQGDLPVKNHFDGAFIIVDGYVLQDAPFDAWSNGQKIDVPLIIGSCANEIDYNPTDLTLNTWSWDKYQQTVEDRLGNFNEMIAKTALALYPVNMSTPEFQFTSMVSDLRVNCPTDIQALYASVTFKSPVYRYVVTSTPSVPVHPVGLPFPASYSFHMWDVIAFFGFVQDLIKNPTQMDLDWQSNVKSEVMSFVLTGRPASNNWSTYPRVTALLSSETFTASAYNGPQCEFWLANGFFAYAWIN